VFKKYCLFSCHAAGVQLFSNDDKKHGHCSFLYMTSGTKRVRTGFKMVPQNIEAKNGNCSSKRKAEQQPVLTKTIKEVIWKRFWKRL
jgi:hypothetical protein